LPLIELGTGAINLVATSKGLGKSVISEFSGIERSAQRSGGRIGSGLFGGLRKNLSKELAPAPGEAEKTGRNVGKRLGGGFSSTLRNAVAPALAVFSAGAIVSFGKKSVDAFSELEDSTAAAGVVFGDSMQKIIDQSAGASKQMGLTKQQVINAANTFGTYGKAAGLSGEELADFATQQTQLASDMASFKGTSPEQAIEAIGAALRGETEPIRAYGVMLDDASLRQEALAMGLISTTKDALTPQNKTLAAQALIMKQTTDAQGDFARTSSSTANIQKQLSAATADVSAKFGQVLAPAFTAARTRALGTTEGVSALLDRVLDFQGLLSEGATTSRLVQALGLDPSQGFGLAVNEGIGSIYAFQAAWKANDGEITSSGVPGWFEGAAFKIRTALTEVTGGITAFGAAWRYNDGDITSSGFPGFMENLAYRLHQVWDAIKVGNLGAFGETFSALTAVARPAAPILVEVGKAVGAMSGEIGALVAGALPLALPLLRGATTVMNYLAENTGVLTGVIIGLAAGYVAVKAAVVAATVADLLRVPLLATQAVANMSLASAIRAQTAAQATNNVVSQAALGNKKTTAVALAATATATTATTAATGGLSIAQGIAAATTRALGFAVKALPFVGLLAILASAVAGLIVFFTQTETGQRIVQAAWTGIQSAVGAVVSWFQGTVVPIAQQVFGAIGKAASWLHTNVITPAFAGIQKAAGWVVGAFRNALAVAQPVFSGIGVVLNSFWMLASKIFEIIVAVITKILIPAFMGFWKGTIVPVFAAVGAIISSWWARAQAIFGLVVAFVRNTLGAVFTWLRDNIITPVFGFISGLIDRQIRGWTAIFQTVVTFFRNTLGPVFSWLYDRAIKPAMDKVGGVVRSVYDKTLKPIFDGIADIIQNKVPKAFELGVDAAGAWFKGLENLTKAPIRFVVETVLNDGLIANVNKIASKVGVDPLPDVALPDGFHRGGIIPGRDPGKRDNVLTPMRSGEGVLVPEATRGLGHATIHALNRAGNAGGVSAVRQYLNSPTGAVPTLNTGFPGVVASVQKQKGGAPHAYVEDNVPGWQISTAIASINSMSALKLTRAQTGMPRIQTGTGYDMPDGVLAFASGNNVVYNGNGQGPRMGTTMKRAVSIHEMLHVLGMAHTNNASIMQPTLRNHMSPTQYDVTQMQRLYGAGGGTFSGGGGDFDTQDGNGLLDVIISPFREIATKLIDSIKEQFPGSGTFVDLAVGAGKSVMDTAIKFLTDSISKLADIAGDIWSAAKKMVGLGGDALMAPQSVFPTLYDDGGVVPYNGGRPQLIQNKTRKPELLHTTEQLAARDRFVAAEARYSVQQAALPSVLRLRVGDREFDAYVEELAVNASGSALSGAMTAIERGGKHAGRY